LDAEFLPGSKRISGIRGQKGGQRDCVKEAAVVDQQDMRLLRQQIKPFRMKWDPDQAE